MRDPDPELQPQASSKERILNAAQSLFAKKGFDGARVDEIARLAGVNKALIYYYFKSKEEILHALLHAAIDEIMTKLGSPVASLKRLLGSKDEIHELLVMFISFLEDRRELIAIVMMELLKESDRQSFILSHLGEEVLSRLDVFDEFDVATDPVQSMMTEFYTGLMPLIMFVLLKKPWKKLYVEDEEELTRLFIRAFEATHVRYTLDLLESGRARGEKEEPNE